LCPINHRVFIRKERGIALAEKFWGTIYAPKELELSKDDLAAMHGVDGLSFGEPVEKERMEKTYEDIFLIE